MSNPTCTKASLNIFCFRGYNLDPKRRLALLVFFKASELALIGGTDYRNLLTSGAPGGLIGDTMALMDEKTSKDDIGYREVIGTFELAIARNTAVAAGLADATIQQRMVSIQCLLNVNTDMLRRMVVFLDCQLGVHKSFPQ